MKPVTIACALLLTIIVIASPAGGGNWPGFRGPDGSGVSSEKKPPVQWSDSENLKWKTPLPGPGSSSPIVWGDRVFVTCYSGYGLDRRNPGDRKNLKRHLICMDRGSGKVLWNQTVAAAGPEDPYRGFISEHGYASHTPVTDGKSVFVFFGKTGAMAFDFEGKKLWHTPLGTMSGSKGWGSAGSPILHEDTVIVNADDEGRRIVALDKKTGKRVYREKLIRGDGNTIPTRSVYASITKAAGKFYAVSRKHGTFILEADPKFRQLAVNQFASDTSDFNASPAISDGQIFLRSNRSLYCIQNKGASIALTGIELSGDRPGRSSPQAGP